MAKKTSEAVDNGSPNVLKCVAAQAENMIREEYAGDAEANAQIKDHYNVVLHHLKCLAGAVETYRKAKPE